MEGMKFEGIKQTATCKDDGQWSIPTPRCLAPCLVPSIDNGVTQLRIGDRSVVTNQNTSIDQSEHCAGWAMARS